MSTESLPLILSLKPDYADLVFDGLKAAELRRRIASYSENRDVFVYVSSPIMQLRGGFRVGRVWKGSPEDIWRTVSQLAAINKRDFDAYFDGSSVAYALEIASVWEYEDPISLGSLRRKIHDFVVPQSWRYVRTEEFQFLAELTRGSVRSGRTIDPKSTDLISRRNDR